MDDEEQYRVPLWMHRPIRDIVHQLVIGNHAALVAYGRSGKLSASQLRHAVEDYGRTLVELPNDAFDLEYAKAYFRPSYGQWGVDVSLWTKEEGQSDLTIQLVVEDTADGVRVKIADIHVM